MDENVSRILQMVQEGKISVQEATALIAAVRGEQAVSADEKSEPSERRYKRRQNGPPPWFWLCLFGCRCPWLWLWFWLFYIAEAKKTEAKKTEAKKEDGS